MLVELMNGSYKTHPTMKKCPSVLLETMLKMQRKKSDKILVSKSNDVTAMYAGRINALKLKQEKKFFCYMF